MTHSEAVEKVNKTHNKTLQRTRKDRAAEFKHWAEQNGLQTQRERAGRGYLHGCFLRDGQGREGHAYRSLSVNMDEWRMADCGQSPFIPQEQPYGTSDG